MTYRTDALGRRQTAASRQARLSNAALVEVDRLEEIRLWTDFPIWIDGVSRVQLRSGLMAGLTGTVIERRDPLVWLGVVVSPGQYRVRWDDPQYGESGWLQPNTDLELLQLA